LKNLTTLSVHNYFQGVGNLACLRAMPKLQQLSLSAFNLNDASLEALWQIRALKWLGIQGDLTQAGIDRLQSKLPNCRIDWRDIVHLDGE
jgi:hypothetical protein